MAKISEKITAHRNGCLREWEYDFNTNTLQDLTTGEIKQMGYKNLADLKANLKKQGFKFLPYNPDNMVMTPSMRQDFRNTWGY